MPCTARRCTLALSVSACSFLVAQVGATLVSPAGLQAQRSAAGAGLTPPAVRAVPHVDTVAGVEWNDPYAWLRDDRRQRPEVLAHLRAEKAYTEAATRHTRPLQDTLFRAMVGHIKETDLNVEPKPYPAILATAGLNDPRVNYWEPAKWVARLRATKTDANPVLLRINMGAGMAAGRAATSRCTTRRSATPSCWT